MFHHLIRVHMHPRVSLPAMSDLVSLHALSLVANIGADCWGRSRPQPVLLTVHVHTSLSLPGRTDNVTDSIHYGHLSTAILALQAPGHTFPSLMHLAEATANAVLLFAAVDQVHVLAEAPKLLLQAQALCVEIVRGPGTAPPPDMITVKDLSVPIIIGVNPPEREQKQLVLTTVTFTSPNFLGPFPHRPIVDHIASHIENTSYLTLEAFVTSVARVACFLDGIDLVTVKAHKPSAVSFGHSSAVQVSRDRTFFQLLS